MLILVNDTETSGFPSNKRPLDDEDQPHIVQLAAKLVDDQKEYKIVGCMNAIVRCEHWASAEGAVETHGITTEYADKVGISEVMALVMYLEFLKIADMTVAHNVAFDKKIVEIAVKRFGSDADMQRLLGIKTYCTMAESKNILKLPPTAKMRSAGFGPYKNPKLSEAYKVATGNELSGAHDAMVDVDGCLEVYKWLMSR